MLTWMISLEVRNCCAQPRDEGPWNYLTLNVLTALCSCMLRSALPMNKRAGSAESGACVPLQSEERVCRALGLVVYTPLLISTICHNGIQPSSIFHPYFSLPSRTLADTPASPLSQSQPFLPPTPLKPARLLSSNRALTT